MWYKQVIGCRTLEWHDIGDRGSPCGMPSLKIERCLMPTLLLLVTPEVVVYHQWLQRWLQRQLPTVDSNSIMENLGFRSSSTICLQDIPIDMFRVHVSLNFGTGPNCPCPACLHRHDCGNNMHKATYNIQKLWQYYSSKRRFWQHPNTHDDVIKWKHFPRYWPFVQGIHRSPMNYPHKGQWRGALMFSLIYVWINGWVNNREAGDWRRYRAHYDVIVMSKMNNVLCYWRKTNTEFGTCIWIRISLT